MWQVVPSRPEFSDMAGTRFQSDKPIAVYGGHAGTMFQAQGATNPLVESYPPTTQWGTEFHSIPLPERTDGHYKILAHRDNTLVRINNVLLAVLNAGEHVSYQNPEPIDITSNEPIIVAQFTHHLRDSTLLYPSSDPSMTLLQPYGSWTTEYRWQSQDFAQDPIQVTQPGQATIPFTLCLHNWTAGFIDSIFLDDVDISNLFQIDQPDKAWQTALIPITPGGAQTCLVCAVSAELLGYSHFDAYFMPARLSQTTTSSIETPTHYLLRVVNRHCTSIIELC